MKKLKKTKVELLMKLDKSPVQINKMFDTIAFRYDLMNDIMTFFSHRTTRKKALKFINFNKARLILDLATGTGDLAFLLANEANGFVIGIDNSINMLSKAFNRQIKFNKKNKIAFQIADINTLPFLAGTFDLCTIGYGIRNVSNPLLLLKEIFRVTKEKGILLIIEATSPRNKYIRKMTFFYFKNVIPILAKVFSSNEKAYSYLGESIEHFPDYENFKYLIKKAGWKHVFYVQMLLGTVSIFITSK